MLVKGFVFAALVASTPIAIVATQDPRPQSQHPEQTAAPADAAKAEQKRAGDVAVKNAADLAAARQELAAARSDLEKLGRQLEQALDALDRIYEPQRDRNCSPTRSRALMTHYQWLRGNGHEQRAATTLAKVVEQAGDNPNTLNNAAWELMTNTETAGKFDEVALAYARRMQELGRNLEAQHLDTVALAHFLNGEFEEAVALQRQAIERGGRGDDFRRRLRTYEAAQATLTKASAAKPAVTMVASGGD